jgi:hypothetical protein
MDSFIGKGAVSMGVIPGIGFQVNEVTETWSDNYTLGLAPGEVVELSANNGQGGMATWQAVSGTHRITAHVDDIGRIDQSDRDNNQLVKILSIG